MKNKFLELLKSKGGEINTLLLPELLPEITGEGAMFLPTTEGYNNNILLLGNVNVDFIKTQQDIWMPTVIKLVKNV